MYRVYVSDDHLLMLGTTLYAQQHQHLYSHLIVQLNESKAPLLSFSIQQQSIRAKALFIGSHVLHDFSAEQTQYALLLIDHTSDLGRCLEQHYLTEQQTYAILPNILAEKLAKIFNTIKSDVNNKASYHQHWQHALKQLQVAGCPLNHRIADARITKLLSDLTTLTTVTDSIQTLAQRSFLSPSRLSHLFKQHTGVTLKSYLLFKQLLDALSLIAQGELVTHAALSAGFDSPSHLSSSCKRLVGIQPNLITKVSVFLKVTQFH